METLLSVEKFTEQGLRVSLNTPRALLLSAIKDVETFFLSRCLGMDGYKRLVAGKVGEPVEEGAEYVAGDYELLIVEYDLYYHLSKLVFVWLMKDDIAVTRTGSAVKNREKSTQPQAREKLFNSHSYLNEGIAGLRLFLQALPTSEFELLELPYYDWFSFIDFKKLEI